MCLTNVNMKYLVRLYSITRCVIGVMFNFRIIWLDVLSGYSITVELF